MRRASIKLNDIHCQVENGSNSHKLRRKKSRGKYFKEFTSNTSLHGLKYVGESERSKIERIWWAIMVFLCTCVCGYLIIKVLLKWHSNPVIVSFAESPTPIWQLPFPAVTICPIIKSIRSEFNFTEYLEKAKKEENSVENETIFNIVSQFCTSEMRIQFSNETNYEYVKESDIDAYLNVSLYGELFMLMDPSGLDPIITREGICYTYNMLSLDEIYKKEVIKSKPYQINATRSKGWTMDRGYPKDDSLFTYPRRAEAAGSSKGFEVQLATLKSNIDTQCSMFYKGFKVSLHAPNVLPDVSQNYFWVAPESATEVSVKPSMITTSDSLRGYLPEKRLCYFSHERNLAYFREYTRESCDLECFTNLTLAKCGCVHLVMPRINDSTPICGAVKKNRCIMMYDRTEESNLIKKCNCLPSCTSISYETSTSNMIFDWDKFVGEMFPEQDANISKLIKDLGFSHVRISFQDPYFIASKRSELYGIVDFLSNCGGLLGVCLGFSILSLVEIFYFFIVKVIIDIRKSKKMISPKENTA